MPETIADAYEALTQFLYRSPIGLMETTIDGEIEMINPKSSQFLMPLSLDGGLSNLFTVLEGVAPQLRQITAAFGEPNGVVCESIRIQVDAGVGSNRMPQILAVSLMKLNESKLMAVLSDVTIEVQREQAALDRRLRAAARTDTLTRMPNRAAVLDRVQEAMVRAPMAAGEEMAVLFMNCDRFKQINDTLGHATGDEVLSLIADRLRSALRRRDRDGLTEGNEPMAARIGGDEFVIVLDDLHRAEDAHAVAQRVLEFATRPYGVGPHQVNCTMSMGVVLQAQMTGDADAVLQNASIAMVEAKRAGGGRYTIFEPTMQIRAARRGGLETDLRRATADGQLFVVYQPLVDLQERDGTVGCAGVESLVRWLHPSRGLVHPLEFIGVAEECGLIGAVGEFVLTTACAEFVRWQRDLGERAPRTLAVNLSRAQLALPRFVDDVQRILDSTGMPARQLHLEVTESLAAQDASVRTRLHELKELGVTLALDDFGTGYSSLASLHELPVDTVKIDRSFVCQSDTSHHHRVLIEATVRVANSLGMSTVAEGIETEAQAAVVRDLGCDVGQGYLFSKPLPTDSLVRWVAGAETHAA